MEGRAWLAALPEELAAQRRVLTGLVERCEAWPLATSLVVGCSLGRGAADELSDIDAALGVDAPRGDAGAGRVTTMEAMVVAALPELGALVDVLRHPAARPASTSGGSSPSSPMAPSSTWRSSPMPRSRRAAAPAARRLVSLYQAPASAEPDPRMPADGGASGDEPPDAYAVTGEQVREWAFLGWIALIDADKYLRRGSLWEAHSRLQEARHRIWALWAAAQGAMYPWHGLSQVLDHDPADLPPGIESTVAGLDAADLRRAARASAGVLAAASEAAARRHPADLPAAMADYVTRALFPDL